MRLALQVLELALKVNLDLNLIWVSWVDPSLQKAKAMTKQGNLDNWWVHPEAFGTLQRWFGKLSVDLFASPENFKVAKYYSYCFSAGSAGLDAFFMSWEGENAYCVPPIALILRVIRKIEVSKMTGVLLIPLWLRARFWLHALPAGRHLGGVFRSFKQLKVKTRSRGEFLLKTPLRANGSTSLPRKLTAAGTEVYWSRLCPLAAVLATCFIKIVYVS
jgi:hypothetical protein